MKAKVVGLKRKQVIFRDGSKSNMVYMWLEHDVPRDGYDGKTYEHITVTDAKAGAVMLGDVVSVDKDVRTFNGQPKVIIDSITIL